jgi:hypothetical protein
MGQTALLPIRGKSCYGFLSPLESHRPRPGLNPRTFGPMASTLASKPPTATTSVCYFHFFFLFHYSYSLFSAEGCERTYECIHVQFCVLVGIFDCTGQRLQWIWKLGRYVNCKWIFLFRPLMFKKCVLTLSSHPSLSLSSTGHKFCSLHLHRCQTKRDWYIIWCKKNPMLANQAT